MVQAREMDSKMSDQPTATTRHHELRDPAAVPRVRIIGSGHLACSELIRHAQGCFRLVAAAAAGPARTLRPAPGRHATSAVIVPTAACQTWLMSAPLRCLVTGASGYIGGRLVPELLSAGYGVRCMARDPGKLDGRPWSGDVEVAAADAMDGTAVRHALEVSMWRTTSSTPWAQARRSSSGTATRRESSPVPPCRRGS